MRKKMVFLCSIILLLTLMGNSQAKINEIRLQDFPKTAKLWDSLQLQSASVLGNMVILPRGSFNQQEAANIISRLDQLPPNLLRKTTEAGITVQLFTGKLTENPTASHLAGIIPRGYSKTTWDDVPGIGGSKTVLIKIGASQKGKGHGSVNLELHELAHSIDRYVLNDFRHNPDFIHIWRKEKDTLFPGQPYFLTYPEEYFAECFAYFYMGGSLKAELKEKAPLTFQLIQKLT